MTPSPEGERRSTHGTRVSRGHRGGRLAPAVPEARSRTVRSWPSRGRRRTRRSRTGRSTRRSPCGGGGAPPRRHRRRAAAARVHRPAHRAGGRTDASIPVTATATTSLSRSTTSPERWGVRLHDPAVGHRQAPPQADDDRRGVRVCARPGPPTGQGDAAEPADAVPGLVTAGSRDAYPDPFELFADGLRLMREEAEELARMGCRYIQIDAPDFGQLVDPSQRDAWEQAGISFERVLSEGADMLNEVARIPGVTFGVHMCKGNYDSHWISSGTYETISAALPAGGELRRPPARVRRRAFRLLQRAQRRPRRQGGRARHGLVEVRHHGARRPAGRPDPRGERLLPP